MHNQAHSGPIALTCRPQFWTLKAPHAQLDEKRDWVTMHTKVLLDPLSHHATMGLIWLGHQVDILTTLSQVWGYGPYSFHHCRHPTGPSLHRIGPKYCAVEALHDATAATLICLHGLSVAPNTSWYRFSYIVNIGIFIMLLTPSCWPEPASHWFKCCAIAALQNATAATMIFLHRLPVLPTTSWYQYRNIHYATDTIVLPEPPLHWSKILCHRSTS